MTIRCKMRLQNIFGQTYGGVKAIFVCEYDPKLIEEDKTFAKATPSGMAEFIIDNPRVDKELVIGGTYYFDISLIEDS